MDDVYNQIDNGNNKKIVFAKPCPVVRWAGDIGDDQGFEINLEQSTSELRAMSVTVFNPDYQVATFAEALSDRLLSVNLKYREVGALRWDTAKTHLDVYGLVDIDFANKDLITEEYASVSGKYEDSLVQDGEYEIMVETDCDPIASAPTEFNRFSDAKFYGVIDGKLPKLHGTAKPEAPFLLWPGHDIHHERKGALPALCACCNCGKNHRRNELRVFDRDDLDTFYEDNVVGFAFDATYIDYELLSGKMVHIELSQVYDAAGNLGDVITHQVAHAEFDVHQASTSFELTLSNFTCSNPVTAAEADLVKLHIIDQLDLELAPSRISLDNIACDQSESRITARVSIAPWSADSTEEPSSSPSQAPSESPSSQ